MPAMSPTMTEGGIASWKKREGETFSAGDVLLEIETDKATIDVEAQEDGVVGKILLQDGVKNVPVGKVIALLAEEGDNLRNLQPPSEEPQVSKVKDTTISKSLHSPPPTLSQMQLPTTAKSPAHISSSRPLFPSVHRLIVEYGILKPENIKGTGVRGMLTKGDILTYLGKASGPTGTFKEASTLPAQTTQTQKHEEFEVLDGATIRRLIVSTMLGNSAPRVLPMIPPDFDSIVAEYLPLIKVPTPSLVTKEGSNYLDGLY